MSERVFTKGCGVFIKGVGTPAVCIETDRDGALGLLRYGNLAMRRVETHWFSTPIVDFVDDLENQGSPS